LIPLRSLFLSKKLKAYEPQYGSAATAVSAGVITAAVVAESAEQKDQDQPIAGVCIVAENAVSAPASVVVIIAEQQ